MVSDNLNISDSDDALCEIKDRAVMLSIAGEYLCDARFLKKIGLSIEEYLKPLEDHIEDLKSQFVGRPVEEIDIKGRLKAIDSIAKLLEKPDDETKHRCADGSLGIEIGEKLKDLVSGINELRGRIDGSSVSYTAADSVKVALDRVGTVSGAVAGLFKTVFKIVVILALVVLVAGSLRFFALESEKGILKEIEENMTQLQPSQKELSGILNELDLVQKETEELERRTSAKKVSTELMDLNVRALKLAEERDKIQAEVDRYQESLDNYNKKLEYIRAQTFIQRMLGKKIMGSNPD